MKKFIVTILAVVYLSSSMGATIHLHYCMGKLADWGILNDNSSKCSKCGMEKGHNVMDDGCCNDEYKQIKNERDQKISENYSLLTNTLTEITPINFPVYSASLADITSQDCPKAKASSRSCRTSLNVINCIFRI